MNLIQLANWGKFELAHGTSGSTNQDEPPFSQSLPINWAVWQGERGLKPFLENCCLHLQVSLTGQVSLATPQGHIRSGKWHRGLQPHLHLMSQSQSKLGPRVRDNYVINTAEITETGLSDLALNLATHEWHLCHLESCENICLSSWGWKLLYNFLEYLN